MTLLLSDPWIFATALASVILIGLSKGGLGGAAAVMGVPLMSLVMSPIEAAAVLLPILIVADIVSLWTWRGYRDGHTLRLMLPGALIGVAIGWALAANVSEAAVRLIVGLVAGLFAARWFWGKWRSSGQAAAPSMIRAGIWSTVSGYTSFVAHAGGPPFQMYALPLGLHPRIYTGTSVIYFAVVNAVKVAPYFALGQFSSQNLSASLLLVPAAPLSTLAGAFIIKRMSPEVFYPFTYIMMALVSVKLIWDGVSGLVG